VAKAAAGAAAGRVSAAASDFSDLGLLAIERGPSNARAIAFLKPVSGAQLPKLSSENEFAAGAFAAFGMWLGTTTAAAPYRWRAVYSYYVEIRNCGFVTIDQCRAAVSGVGGYCEPIPFYTGPDEMPAKPARKRPS